MADKRADLYDGAAQKFWFKTYGIQSNPLLPLIAGFE